MLRAKNIWVVGGDPRQAALARLLADDGHGVHTYALEQGEGMKCEPSMAGADRADCIVLPLPAAGPEGELNAPLAAARHELRETLDALRPGQLICAGMVKEPLRRMAEERGLILADYFAREELAVLNAIPAALAVSPRIFVQTGARGAYPIDGTSICGGGVVEVFPMGTRPAKRLYRLVKIGLIRELFRQQRITQNQFENLMKLQRSR